jgi:sugar phosphate isomerase/epimerase
VSEAKGGPFVFWGDLPGSCDKAAQLGFDGIEIFAPSPEILGSPTVKRLLAENKLTLAAAGTGAGWLLHRFSLTSPDRTVRTNAREFITEMIDAAAPLGAPVIVGSLQGRFEGTVTREQALDWLAEGLNEVGEHAARRNVALLYEPLNRYETNLINCVHDGLMLLNKLTTRSVKLLADLYHMNIEERSIADALRAGGRQIGHIHFVDSNRRPPGEGHIDFVAAVAVLQEIGYDGYLSAEAVPYPDSETAAAQSIKTFRQVVKR